MRPRQTAEWLRVLLTRIRSTRADTHADHVGRTELVSMNIRDSFRGTAMLVPASHVVVIEERECAKQPDGRLAPPRTPRRSRADFLRGLP